MASIFECEDLWKVHQKVDMVEDIDVSPFNEFHFEQQIFSCVTYPFKIGFLSKPTQILSIDVSRPFENAESMTELIIHKPGIAHGIILWILDSHSTKSPLEGIPIPWIQGIQLISEPRHLNTLTSIFVHLSLFTQSVDLQIKINT